MVQLTSWRSLVAVVALTALAGTGCSREHPAATGPDRATATPTSTPAPVQTPGASHISGPGLPSASVSAAAVTVSKALTGISSALTAPENAEGTLGKSVLVGAARDALLAQAAEYAEYGWTVSGQPRILQMSVRKRGKRLQVRACVDQTAVKVTDKAGRPVPTTGGRTWMIFTVARAGTSWQVLDQTFPAHPNC